MYSALLNITVGLLTFPVTPFQIGESLTTDCEVVGQEWKEILRDTVQVTSPSPLTGLKYCDATQQTSTMYFQRPVAPAV